MSNPFASMFTGYEEEYSYGHDDRGFLSHIQGSCETEATGSKMQCHDLTPEMALKKRYKDGFLFYLIPSHH